MQFPDTNILHFLIASSSAGKSTNCADGASLWPAECSRKRILKLLNALTADQYNQLYSQSGDPISITRMCGQGPHSQQVVFALVTGHAECQADVHSSAEKSLSLLPAVCSAVNLLDYEHASSTKRVYATRNARITTPRTKSIEIVSAFSGVGPIGDYCVPGPIRKQVKRAVLYLVRTSIVS